MKIRAKESEFENVNHFIKYGQIDVQNFIGQTKGDSELRAERTKRGFEKVQKNGRTISPAEIEFWFRSK